MDKIRESNSIVPQMKGCNKPVVVVSRKTDLPNLTEPVSKRAEPQFKGWSTSRVKITVFTGSRFNEVKEQHFQLIV